MHMHTPKITRKGRGRGKMKSRRVRTPAMPAGPVPGTLGAQAIAPEDDDPNAMPNEADMGGGAPEPEPDEDDLAAAVPPPQPQTLGAVARRRRGVRR